MHQDINVIRGPGKWLEIEINRPEKRNALREETAESLLSVLAEAEADSAVRAVVLYGADDCFCAGVDAGAFQLEDNQSIFELWRQRRTSRKISRLYRNLPEFTKPLIAAVEGYALGGGFELALLSDLIVASRSASFGLPEVRLGMLPGGGGTQTLMRIVGAAKAKELIWTGRRIDAETANDLGLLNTLTEQGQAVERARELAEEISANAPLPIMFSKALINRGEDLSLVQGMNEEGDLSFALNFSTDKNEGLAAFKEKRAPKFQGR